VISAAHETAIRQGSEMLIHVENGRIRERNTYDKDPYLPTSCPAHAPFADPARPDPASPDLIGETMTPRPKKSL